MTPPVTIVVEVVEITRSGTGWTTVWLAGLTAGIASTLALVGALWIDRRSARRIHRQTEGDLLAQVGAGLRAACLVHPPAIEPAGSDESQRAEFLPGYLAYSRDVIAAVAPANAALGDLLQFNIDDAVREAARDAVGIALDMSSEWLWAATDDTVPMRAQPEFHRQATIRGLQMRAQLQAAARQFDSLVAAARRRDRA